MKPLSNFEFEISKIDHVIVYKKKEINSSYISFTTKKENNEITALLKNITHKDRNNEWYNVKEESST